ncbi:Dps family protein [Cohnella fermenti]|uniref:DNA starvation/stationary phase protection protein n=1 Tax=Cohnella fermenti TaxID=2565925 RepID=A0A4S4C7U4_9BACL|nr:DNA starvation/stationary phase protection protein [Cohnella fermenti]THF84045.1 DNA starvation/stationary phase protection protein [Cohnella fermenti]
MAKVTDRLNIHLADWNLLYTKLHHYHWYVTGPNFLALHAKFEELYDYAGTSLDEVAERILAIGGKPISTMKQYLDQTMLTEGGKEKSPEEMLEQTIKDFQTVVGSMRETAKLADEAGDGVTTDMLNGHMAELQKQVWMLTAIAKGLPVKA